MGANVIKFAGPKSTIKLDFHALPTPMVEWSGTAKELHDIIIKSWLTSAAKGDQDGR